MRNVFFATLVGVITGLSSFVFLFSLHWATEVHVNFKPSILLGLFFIAPLIIALQLKFKILNTEGTGEFFPHQNKKFYIVFAPFLFISTLFSHAVGASIGREGANIQISALLTNFLKKWHPQYQSLLLCSIAGGFSGAIGAPLAATFFAFEIPYSGNFFSKHRSWQHLPWVMICSFTAYYVGIVLKTPHLIFPTITIPQFNITIIFVLFFLAASSGLMACFFIYLENYFKKIIKNALTRSIIGSTLLYSFFLFDGSYIYNGLGLETIINNFQNPPNWWTGIVKNCVTALSVASGFKGGEFTPLVFVGSSLGSYFGDIFSLPIDYLAALGFSAVFAAATNSPISMSIMTAELFSSSLFIPSILVNLIACQFSPSKGIYTQQIVLKEKIFKRIYFFFF